MVILLDDDHASELLDAHLNPKTNKWADPLPFPADGPKFGFAANTCYDRELNAYFCHVAGDSNDNGVVWVFRYKQ